MASGSRPIDVGRMASWASCAPLTRRNERGDLGMYSGPNFRSMTCLASWTALWATLVESVRM